MFKTDNELIAFALKSWAGYIETTEFGLTRNDAIKSKRFNVIRELDHEQQKLVIRIRELADKYDKT